MGVWDVFDNAVKKAVTKAYQCTYDLGRIAVSKIVDGAVQIPTVTKSVLTSSYDFGCAAVSKIDESVGNDGVKQKVKEYLPGPESREMIVQAFTHPATKEALKLVAPGGAQAAYNIGRSLLGNNHNQNQNKNQNDIDEQNKYEHVIQQLKVLQAENEKMHKQLNKLVITPNNNSSSSSSSSVSEQKPDEVKTEFMTKGPKIKDLLDNHPVVVPSTRRSKI